MDRLPKMLRLEEEEDFEPESEFGKLLVKIVQEGAGVEQLAELANIGNIDENVEVMNMEPRLSMSGSSEWVYWFSKMNLYYLALYFNAAQKMKKMNPIRARCMALISANAYYFEDCAVRAMDAVTTATEREVTKYSKSAYSIKSSQNNGKVAVDTHKIDEALVFQHKTWEDINNFLAGAFKFSTVNETVDAIKDLRQLRNAFRMLGRKSAAGSRKFLLRSLGTSMKPDTYDSRKIKGVKRTNLHQEESRKRSCNERYRLIRRYLFQYNFLLSKEEAVDVFTLNLGEYEDENLDKAIDVVESYDLAGKRIFWKLCRRDLSAGKKLREAKKLTGITGFEDLQDDKVDDKLIKVSRTYLINNRTKIWKMD